MSNEVSEADLRSQVAGREWYHTLELAPGVLTPGWYDLREVPGKLPIPESLAGKRCLDVGSFDGFWAFEMERRGAEEVLAVDLIEPLEWDWPASADQADIDAIAERKGTGDGFLIAREALGSSVEREELSIYELDPERVGKFDFVYIGSLLLHLRDPIGALMAARGVCSGTMLLVDVIDIVRTALMRRAAVAKLEAIRRPWWWKPNLKGLVRMAEAAGFELIEPARTIYMPAGAAQHHPPLRPRVLMNTFGREQLIGTRIGDPHGVVAARPLER